MCVREQESKYHNIDGICTREQTWCAKHSPIGAEDERRFQLEKTFVQCVFKREEAVVSDVGGSSSLFVIMTATNGSSIVLGENLMPTAKE